MLDGGDHYYDTYQCSDGHWVSIGSIEPQFYSLLMDMLGLEVGEASFAAQFDKSQWPEMKSKIAAVIAEKSPLCIRGTKEMLLYARDHSVAESLNYMTAWNASMLLSDDLMEAFTAQMQKRKPEFTGK